MFGHLVGWVDRAKVCFGICNETRSSAEYINDFGQPLIHALARLGPEDTVLDLGAGQAHFGRQMFGGEPMPGVGFRLLDGYTPIGREMAIPNYVHYDLPGRDHQVLQEFLARPADRMPHFVGVARRIPSKVPTSERFRLVGGDWDKKSDPIHAELAGLPRASVIVDEFGILSYTTRPGDYLRFVFDKLEVGGSYFLNHSEMHLWVSYKGRRMSFESFLKEIPGIEVRRIEIEGEDREKGKTKKFPGALQVVKTGEVTVPGVHLGPGVPLHQGVSFRLFLAQDKP